MRIKLVGIASLFLLVAFGSRAEATTACFTWDCDESTRVCEFNSSCSTYTGNLFRYRWDFGDGSGLHFTGSTTITHTYPSSVHHPEVILTVIPLSSESASVECEIIVFNNVGPALPTQGTCS